METQVTLAISMDVISLSTTNEMFRRPQELTHEALHELTGSIKQFGVIQPILLRPDPQNVNRYILISGERRYRASQLAGKNEIPAYVKDVNEEVALILQITENMQREDVHPLNEAKGYKHLVESDPDMTTAQLAVRFAKSETYVLQRLKLNDLVKEAKKDFFCGKMNLGHALILARLTPSDQRDIISETQNYRNGYRTVSELQELVDRHVVNSPSAAPFDKDDADLNKKAGSCTNCPKRSGASPLLFSEIKEKDKCFDRECFFKKWHRFTVNRTKETIETQPETVLLTTHHEPAEEISQLVTQHKIKPLLEYDDFNTHGTGKKTKGFWISGPKAGHTVQIFLKKETEEQKQLADDPKALVAKIQQRVDRGVELDQEKVYAKILEGLSKHATQQKGSNRKLLDDEEVMLWYIVFDKAGYQLKRDLMKAFGITKECPEKIFAVLKALKPEQKAFMLRKVMLDQYGGNYPRSNFGLIVYRIAKSYGDIDIKTFEKEQQEIREKREARAKQRIQDIRRNSKKIPQ